MSEIVKLAEKLSKTPAVEVVQQPEIKEQFITVYNQVHSEGGEAAYERESMYFNRILRDNERLRKSTGVSVYYAFIDLAVKGFSLEQGPQATCYLTPRSLKVGIDQNGRDIYEQQCSLAISGYGEIIMRMRAGHIRHADNPVVVYEGDSFQFGEKDGCKFVNYFANFPRQKNIIACFVKITRMDGSIDYAVMLQEDWERLRGYSERQNKFWNKDRGCWETKPNSLYNSNNGQIDIGFLKAKCIKHAFKTYPKLRIGKASVLESEELGGSDGQILKNPNAEDYYGDMPQDMAPQSQPQAKTETFCPAPNMSDGVRFDTGNADGTF